MDRRAKKTLIIAGSIFLAVCVALVIFYLIPKGPATQSGDKTVIIDNYGDFTQHISEDSFGYLGNYLYGFIKEPAKGKYHAEIIKESYAYASDSWFSTFEVRLKDGDITWGVKLQTLKDGTINGDIGITCLRGDACKTSSQRLNSTDSLQDSLPIATDDYIISYQADDPDKLSVVYYDRAGIGKTKALEKIVSLGFKPERYMINYYYGGR